jgi:hypothetical protein
LGGQGGEESQAFASLLPTRRSGGFSREHLVCIYSLEPTS